MPIDHNRELILANFASLRESIARCQLNDPRTYRRLLPLYTQLHVRAHRHLAPDDPLRPIYDWFERAEVKQALNAAREWRKKDKELNRDLHRQKSLAGMERAKTKPKRPSRPSILGSKGVLATQRATPISKDAAGAAGFYRPKKG